MHDDPMAPPEVVVKDILHTIVRNDHLQVKIHRDRRLEK